MWLLIVVLTAIYAMIGNADVETAQQVLMVVWGILALSAVLSPVLSLLGLL